MQKLNFHLIALFILASLLSSCEKKPSLNIALPDDTEFSGRILELGSLEIHSASKEIRLNYVLPENNEFAEGAPSSIEGYSLNSSILSFSNPKDSLDLYNLPSPYPLAWTTESGNTSAVIDSHIYYCDKVSKVCVSDKIRTKFDVNITDSAKPTQIDIPLLKQEINT